MHPDFFNDDAFSLRTLTDVINNRDYVPGRAGELAFSGVARGIATTTATIEARGDTLSLIQSSDYGAPAPKNTQSKRNLIPVRVPHIQIEEAIQAASLQNVREFGSMDTLRGARSLVDNQVNLQAARHDLTLEHLRLGALTGNILDADGTSLGNLFTIFGVSQEAAVDFDPVFIGNPNADTLVTVRRLAQQVKRTIVRNLKMGESVVGSSARVWALCGDRFFDKLVESTSVKGVWDGWAAAERRLGSGYAGDVYEFAGIMWENYQGTDDNTTVSIPLDKCQFFPVGVPGLYAEYYGPADFWDTVNTVGLPRYARVLPEENGRSVTLHSQMNPLPLCLRPKVLMQGTSSVNTEDDAVDYLGN